MDAYTAKIIAMVVLGLGAFILGILPLRLLSCLKWDSEGPKTLAGNLILSGLLCFGGGVLLATCFTHMLPEVNEVFEFYTADSEILSHIPSANIVLCAAVGFGVGAVVGAPVPLGIAGVFVGAVAGIVVVARRFSDL